MGLLFLNALKGLKSKKIQMIGIICLVTLSTAIYTAMNSALDRMEDRYDSYLEVQNVEDFTITPKIDYSKDYTSDEVKNLKEEYFKYLPKEQLQVIDSYITMLMYNENSIKFNANNNMQNQSANQDINKLYEFIEYIFNITGANEVKLEEKSKLLKEKYKFDYYTEKAKVTTEEKYIYKAIPYDKSKEINIPYLVEGKFPENSNEITLLPDFIKENNLKIGDRYTIGDKEYKIVGTAFAPDHIYPLISFNSPMFNKKTNTIIYLIEEDFKNFTGILEVSYVAAFNDKTKTADMLDIIEMFKDEKDIEVSPLSVARLARVKALEAEISNDRIFAESFLYLLLGISVFIILVITIKRIEDERLQIGVLKALGYNSFSIAISYLVYPVIGALVGGLLGYGVGLVLHLPLTQLFVSFFNLPIDGYIFNIDFLYTCILIPLLVLSILSFIISVFMLRHKPLYLLKEGSNLKVNILNKLTNIITRKLNFKTKFRYSLASRSIGKLFIVTLTSFCTGLLTVLILIGMNLFSSMIADTFNGFEFDNQITYNKVLEGDSNEKDDMIFTNEVVLKSVIKDEVETLIKNEKSDNEKKEDEDVKITATGIDKTSKYLDLKDNKENNLLNKLDNNTVIINTNISEKYNIFKNDSIIFNINDKEYEYKVVGITNSFMGMIAYIDRQQLSQVYGYKNAYDEKYTTDEKYNKLSNLEKEELDSIVGVFSISELKENMNVMMSAFNSSIYVVIAFASLMALVIITIIANIVVEENKRTISLMKVIGYKNKEISSIVLNIYTPFVIIAYLLSIPAMIEILKAIINVLTKDMSFAIPIEFTLMQGIIGLIAILLAYYIAITISKKTLNKVPLSVALKRE